VLVKAKIVSLGHRSGAVIMLRSDSPAKTIKDLRWRLDQLTSPS